jgi:hypothetical protein
MRPQLSTRSTVPASARVRARLHAFLESDILRAVLIFVAVWAGMTMLLLL